MATANGIAFNRRALDYYPSLRRVRRHHEQHISEPLPMSAAARIARLNTSYFSSFFHAKVGARFTDWVHHVRVERAKAILCREDRPIRQVASDVGFSGMRTFQRAFKRHTSLTPREFRRRSRP